MYHWPLNVCKTTYGTNFSYIDNFSQLEHNLVVKGPEFGHGGGGSGTPIIEIELSTMLFFWCVFHL